MSLWGLANPLSRSQGDRRDKRPAYVSPYVLRREGRRGCKTFNYYYILSTWPWAVTHDNDAVDGTAGISSRVQKYLEAPAYVSPIWNCRARLAGRWPTVTWPHIHTIVPPTTRLVPLAVELQPGGQDAGKRADLRWRLHRMAFGGWAASHLLRNRTGETGGLRMCPVRPDTSDSSCRLSWSREQGIGCLVRWLGVISTPIVLGGPATVWNCIRGKHPLPKDNTICITNI